MSFVQAKTFFVVCRFKDGSWTIADFWDLPCLASNRRTAEVLCENIRNKATVGSFWGRSSFQIISIDLSKI